MPSVRIQLPADCVATLLRGDPLYLSALPRKVRTSILSAAEEMPTIAAVMNLPENPSIEEWSAFTPAQRETYSDEIYFAMESKML